MRLYNWIIFLLVFHGIQLCAQSEWKGQWISTERCQSVPNTWLTYRKQFQADSVPESLKAAIAADTKYWLWINGELVVFEGGLKRGPSPVDTYYDEVEIAPYLQEGENTLAVLLWHFGKNGFSHVNSGQAALFFEAISPGLEILSDRSWQCDLYPAYQQTEAPHPNYRLSESNIRFDARLEKEGWNQPDYAGNMPFAVTVFDVAKSPLGRLVKRPIPLFKDWGLLDYTSVRTSDNGDTLFCSLPYNCHATPYLKVNAPEGLTIEMLTDNYTGGSQNNIRAEYITKAGIQEYESLGWMNGHEMWYLIPDGIEVLDVKFRETGYDADFSGSFHCNDPFFTELWKRSARTLYVTMRDTYMDCPDRERAQWWGDEVNELGETFYALSPSGQQLALKGIYELMNWQREDGTFFSPVPSGNWGKELPLQMLASIGWYGFYTHYFYSGDSSFVASVYPGMQKYLHEVWQIDPSGFPVVRHGEWSWGDWGDNIDLGVLTTCWYYLALKAEKAFAEQLGEIADVLQIEQMMQKIASGFDERYWTGEAYRSPDYTGETDDRSQAMAVVSGLASADKYPVLLEQFKQQYHASPYMEKYVLEALFLMKEPDFALDRMKQRYQNMMNYDDYTTLFEGWGIGPEGFGGGTINHAWSGGPLTMLSQQVCGISPLSPGFETFCIQPQLGYLNEAFAAIDTRYGLIEVSMKRGKKNIIMHLTVPENTCAEVPVSVSKTKYFNAGKHKIMIHTD